MSENIIEVQYVKDSLVLFLNNRNMGVGWKKVAINNTARLFAELKEEFPLLDIHEEFTTITHDLLLDIKLTNKERKEATDKFMEYFKQ